MIIKTSDAEIAHIIDDKENELSDKDTRKAMKRAQKELKKVEKALSEGKEIKPLEN